MKNLNGERNVGSVLGIFDVKTCFCLQTVWNFSKIRLSLSLEFLEKNQVSHFIFAKKSYKKKRKTSLLLVFWRQVTFTYLSTHFLVLTSWICKILFLLVPAEKPEIRLVDCQIQINKKDTIFNVQRVFNFDSSTPPPHKVVFGGLNEFIVAKSEYKLFEQSEQLRGRLDDIDLWNVSSVKLWTESCYTTLRRVRQIITCNFLVPGKLKSTVETLLRES